MFEQQGIVRAGEHDGVGALRAVGHEARLDLAADRPVIDRLARERSLGQRGEPRRADEGEVAALAEVTNQYLRVFARDRRLGAEHGDALRL